MRTAIWLAVGAVILAGLPAAAQKEKKKRSPRFLGDWTVVSGEKDGQKEPAERLRGTTVHITKKTITVKDAKGNQVYLVKYRVDLSKRPHPITMTISGGPHQGEMAQGIIQLKGGTLRLCYAEPGGKVPTDFATHKGAKQLLFTMKKQE
jgi:uncharacterized protein (TIGR03067 family)